MQLLEQCCHVLLDTAEHPTTNSAVGIDLEWRDPRPCSLLQIAVNGSVFVVCLLPVKARGMQLDAMVPKDRASYYSSSFVNHPRLFCVVSTAREGAAGVRITAPFGACLAKSGTLLSKRSS